jgi:RND family efflux transporter MFP subunit
VHELASAGGEHTDVPTPQSRWATRLLIPAVIAIGMLAMIVYASWERLMPTTPVRVVPVIVKTVQGTETGSVTVQAPGWVEPDPHPYYASALTNGIVETIEVLEGDTVTAGQVVAHMVDDDAELALARAEASLEQRKGDLQAAKADLNAAQRMIEHLVDRRQAIALSEARISEIDAELAKLDADLLTERARFGEIEDELTRKRELVDSRAVSEATVRRLELRADAQAAAIKAVEARRDILKAQRRQAEADLTAARQHVDLLIEERQQLERAEAAVAQAQAAVQLATAIRDEAQLRLDRMLVRAPVDGVIMRRLASPGSKLTTEGAEHSAHVVHIYDPQRQQVRVDVPLADAANVGVGQDAEIIVEALPDHVFDGRVTRVVHEADIAKNTVEVKVEIHDPLPAIKPEMLARVRFLSIAEAQGEQAELRQRVFVPADVIASAGEEGGEVLVVGELEEQRGRVERRAITLGGTRLGGWREVADGLRPGDLIIANPPAGLREGAFVRVLGESKLHAQAGAL